MLHAFSFRWLLMGSLLLPFVPVSAQSIFTNPITDTDPSTDNPFTSGQTVNTNISVTGIGRGSGIAGNSGSNRYNATGWSLTTLDANDYFTFTITPGSGYRVNFSSFVYTGQRSSTGPSAFALRSSKDGFTANIGTPTATGATLSLSAAAFQNVTTAVEFRFYAWGGSSASGTFSINDFTFNGNVALVLPVELTAFNARVIAAKTVQLDFSTASERNNDYFSIERSADGVQFEAIGRVNGAGNSTVPQHYRYTDEQPLPGRQFYRLQQVDLDGQLAYSPIVVADPGGVGGLRLAPQPGSDLLRVYFEQTLEQDAEWQVCDFTGRLLQSGQVAAESADFQLSTALLPAGNYVLRVQSGQSVHSRQFRR